MRTIVYQLLNHSLEDLEEAVKLVRLNKDKSIRLSDSTTISYIEANNQIYIEDNEFDVTCFPVNQENIRKLKLFLDCFDDEGKWVGISYE